MLQTSVFMLTLHGFLFFKEKNTAFTAGKVNVMFLGSVAKVIDIDNRFSLETRLNFRVFTIKL